MILKLKRAWARYQSIWMALAELHCRRAGKLVDTKYTLKVVYKVVLVGFHRKRVEKFDNQAVICVYIMYLANHMSVRVVGPLDQNLLAYCVIWMAFGVGSETQVLQVTPIALAGLCFAATLLLDDIGRGWMILIVVLLVNHSKIVHTVFETYVKVE